MLFQDRVYGSDNAAAVFSQQIIFTNKSCQKKAAYRNAYALTCI